MLHMVGSFLGMGVMGVVAFENFPLEIDFVGYTHYLARSFVVGDVCF